MYSIYSVKVSRSTSRSPRRHPLRAQGPTPYTDRFVFDTATTLTSPESITILGKPARTRSVIVCARRVGVQHAGQDQRVGTPWPAASGRNASVNCHCVHAIRLAEVLAQAVERSVKTGRTPAHSQLFFVEALDSRDVFQPLR